MKLSSLFTEHCVLQQGKSIRVWGKCRPLQVVCCSFAGKSRYCHSNGDGLFRITFDAMNAGGPYTLQAKTRDGQETAEVQDIMVGEVWLASGQSNMDYGFGRSVTLSTVAQTQITEHGICDDFAAFLKENTAPYRLRYIKVPKMATQRLESDFNACWQVATPDNCDTLTAVGGWYGLFLAKQFPDVTIGIIDASWGGTIVQAWTSENTLRANPLNDVLMADYDAQREKAEEWEAMPNDATKIANKKEIDLSFLNDKIDIGISQEAQSWSALDYDDTTWIPFEVPGSWIVRNLGGQGAAWIRQIIELPENLADDTWELHLGCIDKMDITFVNGVEVGRTGSGLDMNWWNAPRLYSVPQGLLHPGRNLIAIRGYSHSYDGSFTGKAKLYFLKSQKNGIIPLSNQWRFKMERDLGRMVWLNGGLPAGPGNPNMPATLFDGMIRPLIPYAFRGAIWYQGESNANTAGDAAAYLSQIKDLILDWRHLMENGDFPFIIVQLPLYREHKTYNADACWPILRQSQQTASEQLQNVGCVPILDAGEEDDIHPADKRTVGFRLAQWALHHTYGFTEVVCDGPICLSARWDGEKVRLHFQPNGTLVAKDNLGGFCAGKDAQHMTEVPATLDGDDILLDAPADATLVCYAWSDNPKVTLYNAAGFPAKPFKIQVKN